MEEHIETDNEPPSLDSAIANTTDVLLEQGSENGDSGERTEAHCSKDTNDKVAVLENEITQMKLLLAQKDELASLYDREKKILEKEKSALKRELELAVKEKENAVMIYATKEKVLLDARKGKENAEKLLNESKREVKMISTKYQSLNEEKARLSNIIEEKCNEIKKVQRDNEKLKTDFGNLEMKLKWITLKLTQETENKNAIEKRLNEALQEKNVQQTEEKVTERQKMEQDAHVILLKHENERKEKQLEVLDKEYKQLSSKHKELQELLQREQEENATLSKELDDEKAQHNIAQNSLSQELLNSAKLRSQLEDLRILQAQDVIQKEEIGSLNAIKQDLEQRIEDYKSDLVQIRNKESELLSINKEMTEKIVELQNEIYLQASKLKAITAENEIYKKEKLGFDTKYNEIASKLEEEINSKNEERLLLTKHLSEKTKLYEATKKKLDNTLGDLEAVKNKHSQIVKELNREISKYKKHSENELQRKNSNDQGQSSQQLDTISIRNQSDSETEAYSGYSNSSLQQEPSKKHLVDRILRLQQASTRQTEKIDFLENHTMSLVSELQKKSKVLQYYMLRDQAGALTSNKSDQHKTELAKYGGVMSAIYGGIKGSSQSSMTLDLSLEINRKLQAVLEDTLLKNITLKENLDVLGLEVDKLTRQLAQHPARK